MLNRTWKKISGEVFDLFINDVKMDDSESSKDILVRV